MKQRDLEQFKQFLTIDDIKAALKIYQTYWIASSIFNMPCDLSGPFIVHDIRSDDQGLYIIYGEDDNIFNRHHLCEFNKNDAIFTSEELALSFVEISKRVYENCTEWQDAVREEQDNFCSNLDIFSNSSDWIELDD